MRRPLARLLAALSPRATEAPTPRQPEPAPQANLAIIAALPHPVLITRAGGIEAANAASRKLLGTPIVGEDVRVAIRHPAAADRLSGRQEPADPDPTEL